MPTLMQTVFRRPTRSYAPKDGRSPYADYNEELEDRYPMSRPPSRYAARTDHGVHMGYTHVNDTRYGDPGPSRGPSRQGSQRRSTVSTTRPEDDLTAGTRFPKPVRKTKSNVGVRGSGMIVIENNRTAPATLPKKKKKKAVARPVEVESDTSSSVVPAPRRTKTPASRKVKRDSSTPNGLVSPETALSPTVGKSHTIHAPPLASRQAESLPRSKTTPSVRVVGNQIVETQQEVTVVKSRSKKRVASVKTTGLETSVAPPLTPPSSDKSSGHAKVAKSSSKSVDATVPAPNRPHKSPKRKSLNEADRPEIDEDDVFYTPRTSADPNSARSTMVEPPTAGEQPPAMTFQPPTPAAEQDPEESPFASEQGSSLSSSLHPLDADRTPTARGAESAGAKSVSSMSRHSKHHATIPPPTEDIMMNVEDGDSAAGEDGSDRESVSDLPSGSRNSPSGRTQSSARSGGKQSRLDTASHSTGSVLDGGYAKSRASDVSKSQTYDDFVVHHRKSFTRSEASFGANSLREGSIKSGTSGGYGKGGWAAAAASRSGASTPTMFMPSGGADGWADFQPPIPRQSKYTPLPAASQPQTFDNLVLGDRIQDQQIPPPEEFDFESESESSSEDDLPKPSRSYARPDGSSSHSATPPMSRIPTYDDPVSAAQYRNTVLSSQNRFDDQASGPSLAKPIQRHDDTYDKLVNAFRRKGSSSSLKRSKSRTPERARSPDPVPEEIPPVPTIPPSQRSVSRSEPRNGPSPADTYLQTPSIDSQSQYPERPRSPSSIWQEFGQRGFEAPSILNPDTITLLPEMTHEDSAKTYQPSEPSRPTPGQSRSNSFKRPSSVLGGMSKASKSDSGDYEDEAADVLGELPPIGRSKSALGHRNGFLSTFDWEGSSSGEGVLMESHGRDSDSTGGYTNLILPAGAYRPSDPTQAASDLNAKILGLPHANMAAITLSTLPSKDTPLHLRVQTPPVDFTSFIKPPTKIGDGQLLVQVYCCAVDERDIRALDEKTKADVHKWVPGRSFIGRCLGVGADEKDIVKGELVMGLIDIKRSGALAEYILCDRRRLARAPYPSTLTLEQMSLLPLQGIPAIRVIRMHLVRHSRALIMDAHTGIGALICQEMSRAGVNVTALIAGGEEHHDTQTECMSNGARGVLTGSPAAVMLSLDEGGWDFILDTKGGQRVYDSAKRILKNGAKLVTTVKYDPSNPANSPISHKSGGLKALRAAFGSRRKDSKYIAFEYLGAGGTGEPEVDSSGLDCRDVMEEPAMTTFRPVVRDILPLERGAEAFKPRKGPGVAVVRFVN